MKKLEDSLTPRTKADEVIFLCLLCFEFFFSFCFEAEKSECYE